MSSPGPRDALLRRLEQLAAAAADQPGAAAVLPRVEAVQAEVGALRAETGAVRRSVDELGTRVDDVRGVLEARLAVLEEALDGLAERIEALTRHGARTTTDLLRSLTDEVRALDARGSAPSADLVEAVAARVAGVLAERDDALRRQLAAARTPTPDRGGTPTGGRVVPAPGRRAPEVAPPRRSAGAARPATGAAPRAEVGPDAASP